MNERLIAAARAVVQRWHSTDWKAAPTADFIKELGDAADALAAQPAAEPVAWRYRYGGELKYMCAGENANVLREGIVGLDGTVIISPDSARTEWTPLYATQPARAGGDAPFDEDACRERCNICWGDGSFSPCERRRLHEAAALAAAPQPAVPNAQAVGYLDLGVGGYMDIGTDLSDDHLAALPKGRHMLAIIGTHGVDGYQPAPWTAPQPAPAEQHVGDSQFESWFSTYNPGGLAYKQVARDAYAAGMGDPLVQPAGGAVPAIRPGLVEELRADNAKASPGVVYMLPDGRALFRSSAECKESGWRVPAGTTCWDLVPEDMPVALDELLADLSAAPAAVERDAQPRLKVRLTSYPETNGKRNWTAMIVREEPWGGLIGNDGGITVSRGESWNRVAYHAERARFLLGERDTEPHILDYGDDVSTPEEWKGEGRHGIGSSKEGGDAA